MAYKISGVKSETARVMILKESDWQKGMKLLVLVMYRLFLLFFLPQPHLRYLMILEKLNIFPL